MSNLAELQTSLTEAQTRFDAALQVQQQANVGLKNVSARLLQAEKSGDVEAILVLRAELGQANQRVIFCERAVQSNRGALALADKAYSNVYERVRMIDADLAALESNLGPAGYHAQLIAEAEKKVRIFEGGRAGDEAKLAALQAKRRAMVEVQPDAPGKRSQGLTMPL